MQVANATGPSGSIASLDPPLCRSCGSKAVRAVYRASSIPVHSCVLLDSAAEARAFPRLAISSFSIATPAALFSMRPSMYR